MFCDTYGIRHVLNAVATPRANGQCERYNKTIVSALSTTAAGKDERDWDRYVKQIQSALNTSFNKGINSTPMVALIGYNSKHAAEATVLSAIQNEIDRLDLEEVRHKISGHIEDDQKNKKNVTIKVDAMPPSITRAIEIKYLRRVEGEDRIGDRIRQLGDKRMIRSRASLEAD
ncbi:unnamed protein product [Acanthoscelides obtectus]|uniref:Integrase catalytic domain-containing protein n=1 Tax=Acanthoscelides obtectus TaxID=200917 RepID=A0A9P0LEM6_ACAOB|nr:unnamed protein product [Acanthoscelides obtectus]CAK1669149.1 hypothetical protein AOBTE_LOCUS26831 [Acanthoscelides obtectus]